MSGYTEVFAWGGDHYGQLGLAAKQPGKTYNVPRYCSFNVFIRDVACGEEHSAFITINGEVYTMGNNSEGRLGIGNRAIKQCSSPCLVESLTGYRAISISCGWGHTAAVTDSGHLFTWGSGEHGALGLGSPETQWVPAQVSLPQELTPVSVSCGARHTAVILQSRNGFRELWSCGAGEAGQLGTGRREKEMVFARVSFADSVKQVSCGVFHTGFVTPAGRVYMMGGNSFGQLGIGSKKSSSLPQRVTALDSHPIAKLSCGHHSAAVSERGELYLWGTGSFGEYLLPQLVTNIGVRIADVCVGGSFGSAIDVNNGMWTWGSNTNGELGVADYEPRLTPFSVSSLQGKRIRMVACGSSFCLALGQDIGLGEPIPSTKHSKRLSITNENSVSRSHMRSGTAFANEQPVSPLRPRNYPQTPDMSVEKETLKGYYSEVKGELTRLKETAGGVKDLTRMLEESNERLEESKRRLEREMAHSRRVEDELTEERRKREFEVSEIEGELQTKDKELASQKSFTEKIARERTEFEHLFMDRDNQMRTLQGDLDHVNSSLLEAENALRTRDKELSLLRSAHEHVSMERDRMSQIVRENEGQIDGLTGRLEELEMSQQKSLEVISRKEGEIASLRTNFDREKRMYEEALATSKRDLADSQYQSESLDHEKCALETDLATAQRESDMLRQERVASKQELRELLTTKESLLSDLKAHRDKLTYKEAELVALRRDLDMMTRERKADVGRMNQLQDIVSGREVEIEALKAEVDKVSRERKLIAEEAARLGTEVRLMQQEKEKMDVSLEQQTRTASLYRSTLDETQRKFESDWKRKEDDQLQELSKQRETYEGRVSALMRQLSEYEDQNARLKKDFEDSVLRIRRLEESSGIQKERSDTELRRKDEDRARLIENYETRLNNTLRELAEVKEARTKLERDLDASFSKHRTLEETLKIEANHWDEDMKRQTEEHSRAHSKTVDSYELRLATAGKQLNDEQTAKRLLQKDLESALTTVQQLRDALKALQEQSKSDAKRLESESKSSLAQQHDAYEAKIAGLNQMLSDEKDKRLAVERDLGSANQQKRRLEELLEAQQRKCDGLGKEGDELRQLITDKDKEIQETLDDLDAGKNRERDLMLHRDELYAELERQKGLIARLQSDIDEKDGENTDCKGRIGALTQDTNQLKATVDELKYEIEALYKQNHDNLTAMDTLHEVNEDLNQKYQSALKDVHELQVQITELEAKNRELFLTFEKELSNRAREFKERTLSVLGSQSPIRSSYQASSPPPAKRTSVHSSATKTPLTTATSVSKQLDRFKEESPERRAELGLRPETDLSYQQRISRAAERLMDSLGKTSPIHSMRITSPMRQSVSRFTSKSPNQPQRSHLTQSPSTGSVADMRNRLNTLRQSRAGTESQLRDIQQRIDEGPEAYLSSSEA